MFLYANLRFFWIKIYKILLQNHFWFYIFSFLKVFCFKFFSKSYKCTFLRQLFSILFQFKLNFNDSLTDPTLFLCFAFSFLFLTHDFMTFVVQQCESPILTYKTIPLFWHQLFSIKRGCYMWDFTVVLTFLFNKFQLWFWFFLEGMKNAIFERWYQRLFDVTHASLTTWALPFAIFVRSSNNREID